MYRGCGGAMKHRAGSTEYGPGARDGRTPPILFIRATSIYTITKRNRLHSMGPGQYGGPRVPADSSRAFRPVYSLV